MTNIDLCGIAQLLRTLIEQKKTTEREARKILARIAAQTGADIILSFWNRILFNSYFKGVVVCIEDLGRIWQDQMRAYFGVRYVDLKPTEQEQQQAMMMGMVLPDTAMPTEFDFSILEQVPLSIKLDVGGSAYWSEIAQMQTLDNLLMNGQINVVDYLERVPNGYISNQQELIQTLRQRLGMVQNPMPSQVTGAQGAVQAGQEPTVNLGIGSGYGQLQRQINQTGMEGIDLQNIQV